MTEPIHRRQAIRPSRPATTQTIYCLVTNVLALKIHTLSKPRKNTPKTAPSTVHFHYYFLDYSIQSIT